MTRSFRALIAAGAALACATCTRQAPEEIESLAAVPVTVATARVQPLTGVILATAVVSPAPGADLAVVAPEAARIVEMPKAEGDRVARGDLLVRFDIPSLTAELAKGRAEVDRARARLQTARAAAARASDLFQRGVAARKETEDATREVADADADLATAEASSRAARATADRREVRATFAGIITRRTHNPGDLVEPGGTEPILRVIDPARLELVASVAATDALRIQPGALVRAAGTQAGDIEMHVRTTAAAVQPGTSMVPVRIAMRGTARLPVGLAVPVAIDTETVEQATVVPLAAVVREGDQAFVYVVAGGKALRRQVTTGIQAGDLIAVSSIANGESIVVAGQNGLPDGSAVRVSGAATAPPAEHR